MGRYIVKRLLHSIPLILGISVLSFFLMHLAPGDPTAMLVDPKAKPEEILRIKENLGLNKPVIVQYAIWLKSMLSGNMGYSFINGRPVWVSIMERLPATFLLMMSSLVITIAIAIPLGVISAVKKGSAVDHSITVFSFLGMSLPTFWLALVLMLVFALQLGWFPSAGMQDPFLEKGSMIEYLLDLFRHMFLPLFTMTIVDLAGLIRYGRAGMLEVLGHDYIRTARAKGLSNRAVIYKHALKNAILPLITILGLSLPSLFGGAFIIEYIFAWPGMGRLGLNAIFSRDYPMIMGIIMFTSVLIILGNLLADVLYAAADPRIRFSDKR